MKRLFFSLLAFILFLTSCSQTEPILKIGLVADPQYANKPTAGKRYYQESCRKLEEAIDTLNDHHVDFVQNLGDIVDGGWESYDSILPVYQNLDPEIENYHLLGNHDFAIDSSHLTALLERLAMPEYYYSYEEKGWRFIVLDATDVSYFSMPVHQHSMDQVNSYYAATEGKPNHYNWNSAIGKKQQEWLKLQLESAESMGQRVILFSHMPLRPLDNAENLWNNEEIIEIIEDSPNVVAFINGHRHSGGYILKNGIHYITIHGMVETPVNSYAILEVYKDHMALKGYGNQKSYNLQIIQESNTQNH